MAVLTTQQRPGDPGSSLLSAPAARPDASHMVSSDAQHSSIFII